ncbi:MAG: sugar transferase, partial [Anaerolineales bacterium]|nr:sugar transferase [Anaerolineales bacterium]
ARSGLHRLPELWHVLRGDLALVGVRPLPPAEAAALTEEWQQQRYGRPAGFTGPWFVQPDAHTSPEAALMADTYYVATRTWQTDLRLAARTPLAWATHLHTPAPVSLPLEGEGQGGGAPAPTQPAKSA